MFVGTGQQYRLIVATVAVLGGRHYLITGVKIGRLLIIGTINGFNFQFFYFEKIK
jgi:hypothetical protein